MQHNERHPTSRMSIPESGCFLRGSMAEQMRQEPEFIDDVSGRTGRVIRGKSMSTHPGMKIPGQRSTQHAVLFQEDTGIGHQIVGENPVVISRKSILRWFVGPRYVNSGLLKDSLPTDRDRKKMGQRSEPVGQRADRLVR